jgi:hypothetical protein
MITRSSAGAGRSHAGVITGKDRKKIELQVKYAGRFSWYLQKKIEAATWGKSI